MTGHAGAAPYKHSKPAGNDSFPLPSINVAEALLDERSRLGALKLPAQHRFRRTNQG
jgi:hypothetical protein